MINAKSKTCLSKGAKVKAVRSNKLELQLDFAALVVNWEKNIAQHAQT